MGGFMLGVCFAGNLLSQVIHGDHLRDGLELLRAAVLSQKPPNYSRT